MATFEDYFFVKSTRWYIWGGLAIILAALIFHAGVVVGSHRPLMQGRGPGAAGDFNAQIPFGGGDVTLPQGFMPGGHGALGTIASITLPTLTLTSRDGVTLHVEVSSTTLIAGTSANAASTLHAGDTVIVVGDPDDTASDGAVDARLIRVLSDSIPTPMTPAQQ